MRPDDDMDWSLTTWEGARREALRRWARLPLERVVAALEEMQELSEMLSEPAVIRMGIKEYLGEYGAKDKNDDG